MKEKDINSLEHAAWRSKYHIVLISLQKLKKGDKLRNPGEIGKILRK